MFFWEAILNNLPLFFLLILATIVCGADLIKAFAVWRQKRKEKIDTQVQTIKDKEDLMNTLQDLKAGINEVNKKFETQEKNLQKIEQKLADLTLSDMHDIKSWIVDQYHKFYIEQEWIDAFSADTIEHRYEDYKKEGGNSYIDQLMERLRSLPMDPPQK
jgi:predicted nuclease with TOPRIM domain